MPTAFAAAEIDIEALVDLDTYPIHDLASPVRRALVAQTQEQMRLVGCSHLPGFVRADAVARMQAEGTALHDQTYWSREPHNPYFGPGDPDLPATHPRNTFQPRHSGFINSDVLLADSALRQLYDTDILLHFIWECLDVARPVYRWADPIGRNPYGVMETGHYLPWHFDGNEFTVSVLAQKADDGGVFEYVPRIRQPDNENFEHVQHILEGGRDGVHTLDLIPGDMQLFAGRYSMHRVTPIVGPTTRYIGLPTYVHDPFRVNRSRRSEAIYGRSAALHALRALDHFDGLAD
jgi:hypothetical protein